MGLQCTCQQGHSWESIHDAMIDIHQMYPKAGIQEVISLLFYEKNMSVSRSYIFTSYSCQNLTYIYRTIVSSYFTIFKPELIRECKARCLKRRHFWAASVNNLFTINQHDKWLRFGLGLHTRINHFLDVSRGYMFSILIETCSWFCQTTSIPSKNSVISHYYPTYLTHTNWYCTTIDMPLITQSDLGTENFSFANAQTLLHQHYDSDLWGTLQHCWMRSEKMSCQNLPGRSFGTDSLQASRQCSIMVLMRGCMM